MAKQKRKQPPRRDRVRTKTTLTEDQLRVSLATSPRAGERALERDVELAKAALLYADQVEMVGLGVALFEKVRQRSSGDQGAFGLFRALDDEALAYVMGNRVSELPENFRMMMDLMGLPNFRAVVEALPSEHSAQMLEALDGLDEINQGAHPYIAALLEEAGADELAKAIDARVIRVADLDVDVSHLFRGGESRDLETDSQMASWIGVLLERLNDRRTRLLFDDDSAELVEALLRTGELEATEPNLRLARQAALGAGLIGRLPAFPNAPMDELLDLRKDLGDPLIRYRGAVVTYSKQLPTVLGRDLDFEVGQLWEETVAPSISEIEQRLADHALIREMARAADARDLTRFLWTSTASVGLAEFTDVQAFLLGAVAAASHVGIDATISALRNRGEGLRNVRDHELYYLVDINRRLEN